MQMTQTLDQVKYGGSLLREALVTRNLGVLATFLGPAYRGLVQKRGKREARTLMGARHDAHFDWTYEREFPEMARLYEAAKSGQWNAMTDVDWSIEIDPQDPDRPLLPDTYMPTATLPTWSRLSTEEKNVQRHAVLSWMLSQFLHGEQGALFASAQVTEAVPWLDGKLYGGSQVMDEARHVEVFNAYLDRKLEKRYEINDNLYIVIDALMRDSRWDLKFLGMQIMVEGLALAAFSSIRHATGEPLLKEILRNVISDEARHVHYGVLALGEFYHTELSDRERRLREDWAFEVCLMLRNRFLAHEVYDEFYAHQMSRSEWDRLVGKSEMMGLFRRNMFRRTIPNLKRIGLLSDRLRPHYEALGVLDYEHAKAADELTAEDLLDS